LSSIAAGPGIGATKPGSADGLRTLISSSFFGAFFSAGVGDADDFAGGAAAGFFSCAGGGVAGGVGGAAPFAFESREPTCSFAWYFFRMLSLWYFQNCFEASLPATRWRTVLAR